MATIIGSIIMLAIVSAVILIFACLKVASDADDEIEKHIYE